jgi:hypothetical protein
MYVPAAHRNVMERTDTVVDRDSNPRTTSTAVKKSNGRQEKSLAPRLCQPRVIDSVQNGAPDEHDQCRQNSTDDQQFNPSTHVCVRLGLLTFTAR